MLLTVAVTVEVNERGTASDFYRPKSPHERRE